MFSVLAYKLQSHMLYLFSSASTSHVFSSLFSQMYCSIYQCISSRQRLTLDVSFMAESPCSPGHGSLRPGGVLREIHIRLLECKVCFEKFSTRQGEHRPQNLSCGHVLCLECVRSLTKPLVKKLECPFCRQLCDADSTSHCQALTDLQDLLSSTSPGLPGPQRANGGSCWGPGLGSKALWLSSVFGGWGTLMNPTGVAVLGSSGTTVVVHDGEHRLVVFGPQGRKLHSFGRRGRAQEQICYPMDVAVTPSGYVVVTDAGDCSVKVFTSGGKYVTTVRDFLLPWGVETDSCGHILVTDARAGTLTQAIVDYAHGVTLAHPTVLSDLRNPRAVACCRVTGNTALVEHLVDEKHPRGSQHPTSLKVFDKDFQLRYQMDTFSLTLGSRVWLSLSAVAFDREGHVIVIDSKQGMVWSLGKPQNGLALTPLLREHLVRPVALVPAAANDTLILLDSGDHAVKIYSANPNDSVTP